MAKKILIAEDNENNRLLLKDVLQYYGYEVIEATNGEEAVKTARQQKPDLIFMDIQMPVIDGFTAIKILKRSPSTKHIKIIVVTSSAMAGDKEQIIAAGADKYIAKPINTRELPEIVKSILTKEVLCLK